MRAVEKFVRKTRGKQIEGLLPRRDLRHGFTSFLWGQEGGKMEKKAGGRRETPARRLYSGRKESAIAIKQYSNKEGNT